LCIEASDPQFDVGTTSEFLRETGATKVTVVES
jgi:hypothetical protein